MFAISRTPRHPNRLPTLLLLLLLSLAPHRLIRREEVESGARLNSFLPRFKVRHAPWIHAMDIRVSHPKMSIPNNRYTITSHVDKGQGHDPKFVFPIFNSRINPWMLLISPCPGIKILALSTSIQMSKLELSVPHPNSKTSDLEILSGVIVHQLQIRQKRQSEAPHGNQPFRQLNLRPPTLPAIKHPQNLHRRQPRRQKISTKNGFSSARNLQRDRLQ